jgi:hypothetical protein
MPIFECDCGLIISTSSERTQCLRCHETLGQPHRLRRINSIGLSDTVVICVRTERVVGITTLRVANDLRSAAPNNVDG